MDSDMIFVLLHLNARLQPIHRGEHFEDLIDETLKQFNVGEVTGGGTLQSTSGEIESCDIELNIKKDLFDKTVSFFKRIEDTIPKGSYLQYDDKIIDVGILEGLALYLNGIDLPDEVYRTCDINYVANSLQELLGEDGEMLSHWEGDSETALYFYGKSFDEMKEKISNFTNTYPLCQKCRIVQIV